MKTLHRPPPRYSCLFCRRHLGRNEIVEHCATGRRLAFDSRRGRLWVVCPNCGEWNLTPLDTRWEAIEECERLFAKTPVRVGSDNISLGVVYDALDLIRIGEPERQELAIWRYADELRTRRRRALFQLGSSAADQFGWIMGAGGLVGAGVAMLIGSPVAIGVGMMAGAGTEELWRALGPDQVRRLLGYVIAKVRINTLDYSLVRTGHARELRVTPWGDAWRLELPHSVGWKGYEGPQATNVLAVLLPCANGFGASRRQVEDAVRELERVGDAEAYIAGAAQRLSRWGYTDRGATAYPPAIRLALEMASHEETERQALRGELRWLERRWRASEEVAEIADNLFTADPADFAPSASERHRGPRTRSVAGR